MPSIPQSVLWLSLVVLWLFVLVPMLVSKRENVRRTSDVALATRVLNLNGRLLRRRKPAAGHFSDPHWQPEPVDDDFERHDVDGDDFKGYDFKGYDFGGDDEPTAPRKTVVLAEAAPSTEPKYLDVDVVEFDSDALPVGAGRAEQAELPLDLGSTVPEDGFEEEFEEALEDFEREQERPRPRPAGRTVPDDATAAIRTVSDADFEPEGGHLDEDEPERRDGTEHDYEYVDDVAGVGSDTAARAAEPLTSARRNRYESTTAAVVSARKYRFRKNVLLGMGLALLVTAATAFLFAPAMWWACASVVAVTLLYLGYLRRQTRIEEQLRRRRAQRMARSRLGVENTNDREFDVVPSRLRRPGLAVLEIDDEDPAFEHLEYATYAHYDLPRAAGQ